jgi:glycosyltransferase involved in cell wall biosynthesis
MRILFLSTWFPYPPNQGSKIRAYHLLGSLAGKHSVGLVSFQDGELRDEWLSAMTERCAFVEVLPREPFAQDRIRAIAGWLSPQPRAVYAGYAPDFSERVRMLSTQWKPDLVVALTFTTAPYAVQVMGIPRVLDVDILVGRMLFEEFKSEGALTGKARKYLAYRKFDRYERQLFSQFNLCLVTSNRDHIIARQHIGLGANQVSLVPNGVDLDFFRPDQFSREEEALIFHGALTYFANYDAAMYFLDAIFPLIRREFPRTQFTITGTTNGVDLASLALDDHVQLTGYVEDIRHVLGRSTVCVVPLRKGAGTRIKILEAMAMGVPVVSTSKGVEGLDLVPDVHALLADNPIDFALATTRLLSDPGLREELSRNAYNLVSDRYSWAEIGGHFRAAVEDLVAVGSHDE